MALEIIGAVLSGIFFVFAIAWGICKACEGDGEK